MDKTNKYTLMDPKIDFAFKKIFSDSTREGKIALINLLNAILGLDEKNKVTDILYLNPFSDEEYSDEKQSIMDIRVRTQDNREIDIEMQINNSDNYRKRSLYYLSKMYGTQLVRAQIYDELKKCIVINILDFNLLRETKRYHTVFRLMERNEKFELLDDFELHFIELKKFTDYGAIDNMDPLSRWVIFIKYAADENKRDLIEKIRLQEEAIDMAANELEKLSQDEKSRIMYEQRQKWLMDIESSKEYMRRKGLAEGRAEGRTEGLAEGRTEGLAEGRTEGKAETKTEIAKKLLAMGMDIAVVAKVTGLTEEETTKIQA